MAQVMSELLARFQLARENLALVLEHNEVETPESIAAADQELSAAFSSIMEVQLNNNQDRTARIDFLLKEIISASDRDGLVSILAEKAINDVRDAMAPRDHVASTVSEAS